MYRLNVLMLYVFKFKNVKIEFNARHISESDPQVENELLKRPPNELIYTFIKKALL